MKNGKTKRKTEAQKEREAASPDAPWVDVELRLEKGKWQVAQCYGAQNQPAPDEARKAANRIAAALVRAGETSKRTRAIRPQRRIS